MDPAHQAIIAALRSIRDQADSVLKQIDRPPEQHSMRWNAKACRYVKNSRDPSRWKLLADARAASVRNLGLGEGLTCPAIPQGASSRRTECLAGACDLVKDYIIQLAHIDNFTALLAFVEVLFLSFA